MYIRVVRFTDVTVDRIASLRTSLNEADGPPPGVRTTALTVLFDEDQGTAVVLQYFDTEQDMLDGGRVFAAMDAADTPGTRATVDNCETAVEIHVASQHSD